MEENIYDAVIIGSGLGGLLCGKILSDEGYQVCILEKNNQIGGSLQIYVRDKCIFDSGVHYIGGLEQGQPLYQYFKYFGLMDKLKLKRMDDLGFEEISFGDETKKYYYGMGYENFKRVLIADFPEDHKAIEQYANDMVRICSNFPLYNLEYGEDLINGTEQLSLSAKEYFEQLTPNKRLQNVLAATNILYAGVGDKSPLYVHALVVNSYIVSSYKLINGSSQIANILAKAIKKNGGKIYKYAHVVEIITNDELAEAVRLKDGQIIKGKNFISNIDPKELLKMVHSPKIRPIYRNRVNSIESTISVFILNIVLKKNALLYKNSNVYHYQTGDVWEQVHYKEENWPSSYALFYQACSADDKYASGISLMSYMRYEEVAQWADSYNTIAQKAERGAEYEAFKKDKAEKLLDLLEKKIPNIRELIESYYAATPLTVRDYIGNGDGNLYGGLKDFNNPLKSFFTPRTKITNLLLTGQNLHMHGVYGVTVSAVKTCSELLGMEYLVNKIRQVSQT